MVLSFTIITPTTGNRRLRKLIQSINNQIHNISHPYKIQHYIIIDGPYFKDKTEYILNDNPPINHERFVTQLPFNTGRNGGNFLGSKIYAAFSQFVNSDWVILTDDDNWYDPNHFNSIVETICNYNENSKYKKSIEWVYCLRNIENDTQGYVCKDNCESLGYLHNVFYNPYYNLIDTNCFCVRRDIMIARSNIWNRESYNNINDADMIFSNILMKEYHNFACTQQYTLNYYTDNRGDSVKSDFFVKGNEIILHTFGGIPWQRPILYIAHFDSFNTKMVINRVYGGNKKPWQSVAYCNWNLNFFDKLSETFLLLNAYDKPEYAPSGSKLLLTLCSTHDLPTTLLNRNDIEKIVYTYESPNIRHNSQWDLSYLLNNFNTILTYWKPMLDISHHINNRIKYLPFIGRFDMTNPNDINCIIENKNNDKKICMMLENRDIFAKYLINGIELITQDYLRIQYASQLGKRIYCYGSSWEPIKHIINYCPRLPRHLCKDRVIDLMSDYTFCLIIENCNADGYISEKIYDAFTVGCIPLYYGNKNKLLEIPEDCYIDLKNIKPCDLPSFIDNMDYADIELLRKNIYKNRMDIFQKVSINTYTKLVESIIMDNRITHN